MTIQRRQFEGFAQTHRLLVHHIGCYNGLVLFLGLILLVDEGDVDGEDKETNDGDEYTAKEADNADGPVFSFGSHRSIQ